MALVTGQEMLFGFLKFSTFFESYIQCVLCRIFICENDVMGLAQMNSVDAAIDKRILESKLASRMSFGV